MNPGPLNSAMVPQQVSADSMQAMLADPRTQPAQKAAILAMLQARSPGQATNAPPAQAPAPQPNVDIMGALRSGADMANAMHGMPQRAPMAAGMPTGIQPHLGMARGGPVRGYDDGGSVDGANDDVTDAVAMSSMDGGGSGVSGFSPAFVEMVRKEMGGGGGELTPEDKGLALAQMGFGIAASGSPHLGQAIGQGASYGLQTLQQLRQQRALNSMKAIGLASLMGHRGVLDEATKTRTGMMKTGVLDDNAAQTVANTIIATGDLGALSRIGVGPAGTANKAKVLGLIATVNPDLAQAALNYKGTTSAYTAYGAGQGKRASGTFILNPSQGQTTPGPVAAPAGLGGVRVPGGASGAASQPAPVVPAAPTQPHLASPDTAPQESLIPPAIPFRMPATPAEKEQANSLADKLGKRAEEIDAQAAQAQDANYLLNQMKNESKTWDMGKFAPTIGNAKAYLIAFNRMLPPSMQMDDKKMGESVGDIQAFNKNAMELARQTVRATSARAAFQEMQMIQQALPSANMSPEGFGRIAAQLQGSNDFRLAQQAMKDAWMKQNNNNLNGFDAWFTKNFNPAVFMLHRLSPEDQAAAITKLKQSKEGQARMAKLADQNDFVTKLGIFESLQ